MELTRAGFLVPTRPIPRSSFDDAIDAQRQYYKLMNAMVDHVIEQKRSNDNIKIEGPKED